jgi:hypothetical protein
MVTTDARDALLAILRQFCSPLKRKNIVDTTRLYYDLFIAGDYVDELLAYIHKAFVTILEGLEFLRYFPQEEEAFHLYLAAMLFGFKGRRWSPLTFGHLHAVVKRGSWFEPP